MPADNCQGTKYNLVDLRRYTLPFRYVTEPKVKCNNTWDVAYYGRRWYSQEICTSQKERPAALVAPFL